MKELEKIVLLKPHLHADAISPADGYFIAEQRVLSAIKGLVERGDEELRALPGYSKDNMPLESPTKTDVNADGIEFHLTTNVRVTNPRYQTAFDQTVAFVEVLLSDWGQGIRKDNVRTYDGVPHVEITYLMNNVMRYMSGVKELGVETKIESIDAPAELSQVSLDKLSVPLDLLKDFDIRKPGAAKTWYLAKRFYEEVKSEHVAPFKKEMEDKSGTTFEMPAETQKYWEQIEERYFVVTSIPSPRKEYGKVLSLLFEIPMKDKPKGSTAVPRIPDHHNYKDMLDEYSDTLPVSMKKWRSLEGKIGEVVTLLYGIEGDERVQAEFPYISQYNAQADPSGKTFISVQALYDRLKALEQDYVKNRLLQKHEVVPVA